jgi:hypothetical protein
MIPNVTRGGKAHGVLLYLAGKGKREEHENPNLVAGSPEAVGMAAGSEPLERSDAIALALFLDEPREAFGTRLSASRGHQSDDVAGLLLSGSTRLRAGAGHGRFASGAATPRVGASRRLRSEAAAPNVGADCCFDDAPSRWTVARGARRAWLR